jgi:CheY-like chemotaxis protein
VKQSGGSILVYSELGYGTTFKIFLPRVMEPVVAAAEPSRHHTPAEGSETVLVVEDEDNIRALVSTVLKKQGHTVLEAKNGLEALELCRRYSGKIDLVISDLVMPAMSGTEMVKELVVTRPEIKVLFMSGYTGNAAVHHGAVPPNAAFLEKPFVPRALALKLREVLDRE